MPRRACHPAPAAPPQVWSVPEQRFLFSLNGHTNWVRACALSPDARLAVSAGDDRTVRVWDLETRAVVHTFEELDSCASVNVAKFHPDGAFNSSNQETGLLHTGGGAAGGCAAQYLGGVFFPGLCGGASPQQGVGHLECRVTRLVPLLRCRHLHCHRRNQWRHQAVGPALRAADPVLRGAPGTWWVGGWVHAGALFRVHTLISMEKLSSAG